MNAYTSPRCKGTRSVEHYGNYPGTSVDRNMYVSTKCLGLLALYVLQRLMAADVNTPVSLAPAKTKSLEFVVDSK